MGGLQGSLLPMRTISASTKHSNRFATPVSKERSMADSSGEIQASVETVAANDVGLPGDCSVKITKQSWWDNPVKLAILVVTGFIVASGSVTGAVWSTGRGFFHPGLHSTFWFMIASYTMIMYGALI